MPTISVLIATYNGSFLAETIDSVLRQTFTDFEVLILDDAASRACEELVRGYGDGRLIYISNVPNLGPAKNHASGIAKASGSLISILNHDDLWEPDVLAQLSLAMSDHPDAIAAFSRARVAISDGTYSAKRTAEAWKAWDCEDLAVGVIPNWFLANTHRLGFPIGPAAVFRSGVIKSINIPSVVGGAYDYWLGYRMARLGPIVHVSDAVGYWREHEDNLSHYRSARQVYERLFIEAKAATDAKVTPSMRLISARRVPRIAATLVKELIRGPRRLSRN